MKTFTILGAGWLGFELAKALKTKYKIKVCLQFKFLEKPVDFAGKLRYYEATERKAGQTCPGKLSINKCCAAFIK